MQQKHPLEGLSRRHFLQAAVASATVATLPSVTPAGERPKHDPYGSFTVAVQSYTFRQFNLERTLGTVQDLGVRNIELYNGHVPINSTANQLKIIRGLLQKHQITPVAFGVERFTKDNAANRRLFEFARNLGVRYLSADPDPDSFDSLDKLVAEFNIGIAIHPHGPQGKQLHRWYSAEVIMAAVKNHHRLIGTCLDTGHLIRSAQDPFNRKLDPAQQITHMGPRNYGLHLKDHDNQKRTDVVFGRGVLDVVGILRALRAVKFGGYIAIEYEANPNDPTRDVRDCLEVFRGAVRKLA